MNTPSVPKDIKIYLLRWNASKICINLRFFISQRFHNFGKVKYASFTKLETMGSRMCEHYQGKIFCNCRNVFQFLQGWYHVIHKFHPASGRIAPTKGVRLVPHHQPGLDPPLHFALPDVLQPRPARANYRWNAVCPTVYFFSDFGVWHSGNKGPLSAYRTILLLGELCRHVGPLWVVVQLGRGLPRIGLGIWRTYPDSVSEKSMVLISDWLFN